MYISITYYKYSDTATVSAGRCSRGGGAVEPVVRTEDTVLRTQY